MISMLLTAFIVLCIVGLILWGINQIPGIPPIVKTVIYVVVGIILLVWLLNMVQGGHLGVGFGRLN
jgi:Flp pilus assembly protein TadB